MAELPITFSALIERVRRLLQDSPKVDSLGAAVSDASTTSLTVSEPAMYNRDTKVEVEDEVMLTTTDPSGFTMTVNRGYGGTTAASHVNGSKVYLDPRYYRSDIKEAINVVYNNWFSVYMPRYVWDTTTAGAFTVNRWIYSAPIDALKVIKVAWERPGYKEFVPVQHGPLEQFPTSLVSTGVGFTVYGMGLPGFAVKALYEKPWGYLEALTDTVPVDFPPHADELIVTGSALYLLGWRLIPRLRLDEIAFHRESNAPIPPNISLGEMQKMENDWREEMKRVASKRPGGHFTPSRVWR